MPDSTKPQSKCVLCGSVFLKGQVGDICLDCGTHRCRTHLLNLGDHNETQRAVCFPPYALTEREGEKA